MRRKMLRQVFSACLFPGEEQLRPGKALTDAVWAQPRRQRVCKRGEYDSFSAYAVFIGAVSFAGDSGSFRHTEKGGAALHMPVF